MHAFGSLRTSAQSCSSSRLCPKAFQAVRHTAILNQQTNQNKTQPTDVGTSALRTPPHCEREASQSPAPQSTSHGSQSSRATLHGGSACGQRFAILQEIPATKWARAALLLHQPGANAGFLGNPAGPRKQLESNTAVLKVNPGGDKTSPSGAS